jgi:hypothetical protein
MSPLDQEDFKYLAHGLSQEWLCEYLDISPRTCRDYRSGKRPAPQPILKLLRFLNNGDLSAIGGPEWEGFVMGRGLLSVPLFHRPLPPARIAGMFFWEPEQQARDLIRAGEEIKRLKGEIEAMKQNAALAARIELLVNGKAVFDSADLARIT